MTATTEILKAGSAEMDVEGKGGRREKRKRGQLTFRASVTRAGDVKEEKDETGFDGSGGVLQAGLRVREAGLSVGLQVETAN